MKEDLVERLAKAIYDLDPGYDDQPWSQQGPDTFARQVCISQARACLSEIESAGLVIVPRESTDEAFGLADTIINRLPGNGEHWSLIQRYGAARSAMLAAALADK